MDFTKYLCKTAASHTSEQFVGFLRVINRSIFTSIRDLDKNPCVTRRYNEAPEPLQ